MAGQKVFRVFEPFPNVLRASGGGKSCILEALGCYFSLPWNNQPSLKIDGGERGGTGGEEFGTGEA